MLATTKQKTMQYSQILALSAGGFAIVISSFLFLYIGYWVDKVFNTAPSFMFGLFFLAVGLCVGRLYQEAWAHIGNKKR